MTNGDKLRRMTDKEIAQFLCRTTECAQCEMSARCRWLSTGVQSGWMTWLREEIDQDDGKA